MNITNSMHLETVLVNLPLNLTLFGRQESNIIFYHDIKATSNMTITMKILVTHVLIHHKEHKYMDMKG